MSRMSLLTLSDANKLLRLTNAIVKYQSMYSASGSHTVVMCSIYLLQMQASQLKRLARVVALGIGRGVHMAELEDIASAPVARNVILVHNFTVLRDVEEQLRNTSCAAGNRFRYQICNSKKITIEIMLFLNELCLNMV